MPLSVRTNQRLWAVMTWLGDRAGIVCSNGSAALVFTDAVDAVNAARDIQQHGDCDLRVVDISHLYNIPASQVEAGIPV